MSCISTEAADTRDAEQEPLSKETAFETLSNERRRYVVHHLRQQDDVTELRELSRQVAAWENRKEPDTVTAAERRRVYNALQQSHLPKMDDDGLVEYHSARGEIRPTNTLSDLQVYLEVVPGNDIPWSTYYLLFGVFCSLLTVAVLLGVPPFAPLSLAPVSLLTTLLFTGSAAVHVLLARKRMRLGNDGPPPEL